tara:strand:+ start:1308 stop:2924 length:1617 start_codon:yes stop_codon:yes gene_type:complete
MINSSTQALVIDELKMRYPKSSRWILDGFNLRIKAGERLALIGSSGCGKSTVARVILQLLPPGSICQGNVFLAGKSLQGLNSSGLQTLRGESVGLVFQDPMTRLNPLMTIGNHLIDTLQAHKQETSFELRKQRAKDLLDRVGIDPGRFHSYPHEFSGGMRQRLGIALAIALNPALVIADEPTTSLDVSVANQIMTELSHLCEDLGSALLLVSHDLALASKWCDRMAILDQGVIQEESSSFMLLTEPQSEIAQKLLGAARSREGVGLKNYFPIKNSVVLEVDQLRCWYPLRGWPWQSNWHKAINGVSFSISAGETLGVVGASGCGKSTLCMALMGLVPIRGGTVYLEGQDLLNLKGFELRKTRKLIQMVFQDPLACLNPKMTIGEAICDPLLIHNLCNRAQAKAKTKELLSQVGLCPPEYFQKRLPQELSGGQLQRVVIARALSLNPKVLICDESVSMLDAETQSEVLMLLKRLQRKLGLAILFITHDLSVAHGFCDRLIVLDKGDIVEEGLSSQIFRTPQMPITQQLVDACPKLLSLS